MSKRLDENIGAVEYDGLIVNNVPVADVVTVKLAAGTGILKRGTVVTGAAGAELAPAAAALSATNGTYILTDAPTHRRRRGHRLSYRAFCPQQAAHRWQLHPDRSGRGDPAQRRHPALRRDRILREGGQQNAF